MFEKDLKRLLAPSHVYMYYWWSQLFPIELSKYNTREYFKTIYQASIAIFRIINLCGQKWGLYSYCIFKRKQSTPGFRIQENSHC